MSDADLGDAILRELKQINTRLHALERHVPVAAVAWLTPAEMSRIVGVTPRTLQNYISQGRLSQRSFKRNKRGKSFTYRYHREHTLTELGLNRG
ncbi:helix-turn-helix domain-containing protein [Synechococcus sp. CBW1004]|uniref:helix-turn-helix domain-containing protein n=1 Tax=Synechococcus sp. CBW1004 TaxID=1353136 RepID=UPI0018CF8A43|nr:helix-turn-helix domain-containing protein [Synechococcus sp. CBW1004]